MKIYIVTYVPYPNGGMASNSRINCYSRAILEAGIDCEILVYKRSESFGKKTINKSATGVKDGVPYRYISGTTVRAKNPILRRLNDYYDKFNLVRYLEKVLTSEDVVFTYIIDDISYIRRIINTVHAKRARVGMDLCELPFLADETLRGDNARERMRQEIYSKVDFIIPISSALEAEVLPFMDKTSICCKIPILVDYEKYALDNNTDIANNPFIFHAGSLYERKDGIIGMLRAFGMARKSIKCNLKFISTGNIDSSPHHKELLDIIKQYDIADSVIFTGFLDNDEMRDYLQRASMVIINKYDSLQNRYCFSTKLAEYMAAAKPIIITKIGEAVNWLDNGKTAFFVSPNDINELSDTIIRIVNDYDEARRIGEQAQRLCKMSFDYHGYGSVFKNLFIR